MSSSRSGKCYEKISCDSCGSGDGKQVFQKGDSFDAYCYACGKYDPDPYKGGQVKIGPPPVERDPADIKREVQSIYEFPIREIKHRAISLATAQYFGLRVAVSPVDGRTITHHYYPSKKEGEVSGWEVRRVEPKAFYALGDRKDLDLGNLDNALKEHGRKLYIAEDALSGASIFQSIVERSRGTKWASRLPSVAYLTNGAGFAVRQISKHKKVILDNFDNIVLCLDSDEAGQSAVEKVTKLFDRGFVRTVELPLKDPNDMLMEGRGKELAEILLFRTKVKRFDGVKDVADFFTQATKLPEMGLDWPWPSATSATYGIRRGEIHIIGAAPKIG